MTVCNRASSSFDHLFHCTVHDVSASPDFARKVIRGTISSSARRQTPTERENARSSKYENVFRNAIRCAYDTVTPSSLTQSERQ